MHDVFISYATEDQDVADAIVHILESRRIRCSPLARRDATRCRITTIEVAATMKLHTLRMLKEQRLTSDDAKIANAINKLTEWNNRRAAETETMK
jgi:hypothetical protein